MLFRSGDLKKRRDDMVAEILKEINKVVQDYGSKEGYDIILNDTVLVYKKDVLDVTDAILKAINGQYAPSSK